MNYRQLFFVLLYSLNTQIAFSSCFIAEDEREVNAKLTSFVVNSSLPKTGITKGFSSPTLMTMLDFLTRDPDAIPLLELSSEESKSLILRLKQFEEQEIGQDDLEKVFDSLSERTQTRLEAIASSIDGIGRILERLKFNRLHLSASTIERAAEIRKTIIVERAGPIASSAFALASTEQDRIEVAVAEVKCQIDLGLQLVSILTYEEKIAVIQFLTLTKNETQFRNELVKRRYSISEGFTVGGIR